MDSGSAKAPALVFYFNLGMVVETLLKQNGSHSCDMSPTGIHELYKELAHGEFELRMWIRMGTLDTFVSLIH